MTVLQSVYPGTRVPVLGYKIMTTQSLRMELRIVRPFKLLELIEALHGSVPSRLVAPYSYQFLEAVSRVLKHLRKRHDGKTTATCAC
eukprot:860562-Rhodomonas_salina.1